MPGIIALRKVQLGRVSTLFIKKKKNSHWHRMRHTVPASDDEKSKPRPLPSGSSQSTTGGQPTTRFQVLASPKLPHTQNIFVEYITVSSRSPKTSYSTRLG